MRAKTSLAATSLIGVLLLGQALAWNRSNPGSYQKPVAKNPRADMTARGLYIRKSANAMLVKVLDAKTGGAVSPTKEFTTDDDLTVIIDSNFDSYAYIVNVEIINHTETRYLLYPNLSAQNNRIKADEQLKLPMAFDNTAATEVLQIIVSHDRIDYLDAALKGECPESENRCILDTQVGALVARLVGHRVVSKESKTTGVFPRQSDAKSELTSRDIILAPGKDKDKKGTYVAIPIKTDSDGLLGSKQVVVFELPLKHVKKRS